MLKNNGAVEEAGDFSSGSILNENVNHLVSVQSMFDA